MSHTCPIRGCTTIIADSLILCGPHWRLTPPRLATPLLSKSNTLQRMKRTCKNSTLLLQYSRDYSNALGAVVAWVNERVEGISA